MRPLLLTLSLLLISVGSLSATEEITVNNAHELLISKPSGEVLHIFKLGLIEEKVEIGGTTVEMTFGRTTDHRPLLVVTNPKANDRAVIFQLPGARIFLAPGAIINTSFNKERTKVRIERGPIQGVEVNGKALVADEELQT